MGFVISVCNQKGGCGKTTVATNFATILAAEGADVLLIDADTQPSALDWAGTRPEELPRVSVVGIPGDNLAREVGDLKSRYDYLLIDAGGRVNATARAAVLAADFTLIPVRPGAADFRSTQDFIGGVVREVGSLKEVRAAIVVNELQAGVVFDQQAMQAVAGLGPTALDASLGRRVAYREAFAQGLGVTEYEPSGAAAAEVRALFEEIKPELAQAAKG